jgi:hypothetical protein
MITKIPSYINQFSRNCFHPFPIGGCFSERIPNHTGYFSQQNSRLKPRKPPFTWPLPFLTITCEAKKRALLPTKISQLSIAPQTSVGDSHSTHQTKIVILVPPYIAITKTLPPIALHNTLCSNCKPYLFKLSI